jgi:hypothetical protein
MLSDQVVQRTKTFRPMWIGLLLEELLHFVGVNDDKHKEKRDFFVS